MIAAMRVATALLALAASSLAALATEPAGKRGPILRANPAYDARTVIAPSKIPGSGNGLYARVKIKAGEVIGELGGELLEDFDPVNPSAYVAGLPDCATLQMPPYRYIDSKDHGGHVSRINFAPRTINGRETHFQNAYINRVCASPFVQFVALKDIEPGAEIWSSYGPDYGYLRFMYDPQVRDYFCGLMRMDCRETYEFEH